MRINIFWFRRDLRFEDNIALYHALSYGYKVLPIFIFDQNILNKLEITDPRVNFIYDTLHLMNNELKTHKSGLKIFFGDPYKVWQKIISEYQVAGVYTNKDYEPYARDRDEIIKTLLESNNIDFFTYKDQVLFEENEISKDDGNPYTVFTPYKNKWLRSFDIPSILPLPRIRFQNFYNFVGDFPEISDIGFYRSQIKVLDFDLSDLEKYHHTRDFPAADGSNLGPHLRFGTISIRKIIEQLKPGTEIFLSELIWREFFKQILFHFPRVVKGNFKTKYDKIAWLNNERDFQKWCNGETGYPIVDAGMRQLNETGYMHNRVRMITASFLVKHLLVDWRWGEAYFATKLLDYDLSSNNGNWQWAAGTGCDAAPYFRVFNPLEQAKKFDKNNEYIIRWLPEFKNNQNYIEPIIEHSFARKRALETYKAGLT
ncbi:MAG: deoxyribodipyrimidine photo-lyase [Calditrichaeota bacterium]|nr:MAG: deoxyribodipyrimidine photo-lyase [Calditrichota bacterium]MBL1206146.1 deoxyribodipyrimidine photo-lyase [Calditrichota bacterium]NOG45971.1 deoxyribodipyrimidine photo-lyase [Calditrichota bacterium]